MKVTFLWVGSKFTHSYCSTHFVGKNHFELILLHSPSFYKIYTSRKGKKKENIYIFFIFSIKFVSFSNSKWKIILPVGNLPIETTVKNLELTHNLNLPTRIKKT